MVSNVAAAITAKEAAQGILLITEQKNVIDFEIQYNDEEFDDRDEENDSSSAILDESQ
jgi:hypothetical protein